MLVVKSLCKSYGQKKVLDMLSFSLKKGEILSVVGESGAGKTTLLSIIAGFLQPDKGQVFIDGRDVTSVAPYNREIGLVLQEYSLFPHMTVFQNITFGLSKKENKSGDRAEQIMEFCRHYGIYDLLTRKPGILSGGEKQRVALLRSLVRKPKVLLLDEPFGNLDAKLKRKILPEFRRLLRDRGQTTIHVSHDQNECFFIADNVAVLHDGKFAQVGKPVDIYERPATEYVARFIGGYNVLSGNLTYLPNGCRIVRFCEETIPCPADLKTNSSTITLVIRPEYIHTAPQQNRRYLGRGIVEDSIYIGGRFQVKVKLSTEDTIYYYSQRPIVQDTAVKIFYESEKVVFITN